MWSDFEASLVPSIWALTGFFRDNFPQELWYPYWYLGNPFNYLIGPVGPMILTLFDWILGLDGGYLREEYGALICFAMVMGGFGIYGFLKRMNKFVKGKSFDFWFILPSLFYVFLPFSWLVLNYQDGLKLVGLGVVPFIFWSYKVFLERDLSKNSNWYEFIVMALCSSAVLITFDILLVIIVGLIAIYVVTDRSFAGMRKHWEWREIKIFKTILILILSIIVSAYWYGIQFFWVILSNPSFGGEPLFKVIGNVFQWIFNLSPLLLAWFLVYRSKMWQSLGIDGFKNGQGLLFGFIFFIAFLILTLIRFLANPRFVIDWIGFIPELQLGFSIVFGLLVGNLIGIVYGKKANDLRFNKNFGGLRANFFLIFFLALILGGVLYVSSYKTINNLFFYELNAHQRDVAVLFHDHIKDVNSRIFLSGASVFWFNSRFKMPQVRGGRDESSINPFWNHGAYQIRTGNSENLSIDWLRIFGSSYILVNSSETRDPFKDFEQIEKFNDLHLVDEKDGDLLYKIDNSSIVRRANKRILSVERALGGADERRVGLYADMLGEKVDFFYDGSQILKLKGMVNEGEVVNMAMTYDSRWGVLSGGGELVGDNFGNMNFIPKRSGSFEAVFVYRKNMYEFFGLSFFVILGVVVLLQHKRAYPLLRKPIEKMHLELKEEEDY